MIPDVRQEGAAWLRDMFVTIPSTEVEGLLAALPTTRITVRGAGSTERSRIRWRSLMIYADTAREDVVD
jgi:hypothetical protein